ncbi:hypothetical protein TIFTF001_048462 [Ficus carica]|uniref:Uncharacterized protein n=1 Tax=Ficus carica TaxID=3494 RepID=A0AA88CYI8_FICCA|nr:hypothetical protein TIFTF001_048462 [Ficus carica]
MMRTVLGTATMATAGLLRGQRGSATDACKVNGDGERQNDDDSSVEDEQNNGGTCFLRLTQEGCRYGFGYWLCDMVLISGFEF